MLRLRRWWRKRTRTLPPDEQRDGESLSIRTPDDGTQVPVMTKELVRPPDLTAEEIRKEFEAQGLRLFTGHLNLNLFGIRTGLNAGKWDDWIGALYQDESGVWKVDMYQGTTDPSDEWLEKGNDSKGGTAILKEGQHLGCWVIGLHRAKYPALVQHGAKMTVLRDGNLDSTLDVDDESLVEDHGFHGINLHRGSAHKALIEEGIGPYSAGCQVVCDPADWAALWDLITASSEKYGVRFSYTLLRWPLQIQGDKPLS